MEDSLRSENLQILLESVKSIKTYSHSNFIILDNLMQQYWQILKELNAIAPSIFNNLATNGIIDLINRSNLTEQATDILAKNNHYKDYWDYLTHTIQITIDYINNFLPQSLACSDVD